MAEHILDNPAYHGMISGNRNLSVGTELVRYFPEAVSPFVGLADFGAERFRELAEILPAGRAVALATPGRVEIPSGWDVKIYGPGLQMMWAGARARGEGVGERGEDGRVGAAGERGDELTIVPLRVDHVPQMLALAKLTNPGPFGERTIEFGNFVGVFDGDRLMGMSGHRLHPVPYIEISGVCVHPDYAGRGLGGALTLYQVERIQQMGETPILHVWARNERAIRLYEHLGFVTQREIHFAFMNRSS